MDGSYYGNVDPVVLYDIFAEAATRVIASHVAAIDRATTDLVVVAHEVGDGGGVREG